MQNTSTAVMQRRREPPDSLDFYPTPPWATRALIERVLMPRFLWSPEQTVWEPACGEGHMAEVLKEYFGRVVASDIHDYGYAPVCDFLDERERYGAEPADWIITNPPFKKAEDFAIDALSLARRGVALLVRLAWLEGSARYERLFSRTPPSLVAQFVERVPMVKGEWDPEAVSATAYTWVVWRVPNLEPERVTFAWIAPGQRDRLTKPDDARRFARLSPAPLFDAPAAPLIAAG